MEARARWTRHLFGCIPEHSKEKAHPPPHSTKSSEREWRRVGEPRECVRKELGCASHRRPDEASERSFLRGRHSTGPGAGAALRFSTTRPLNRGSPSALPSPERCPAGQVPTRTGGRRPARAGSWGAFSGERSPGPSPQQQPLAGWPEAGGEGVPARPLPTARGGARAPVPIQRAARVRYQR